MNALRAFEASARHLSIKNAADELSVTPGAVSQMVKALELHLGVRLFERVNRGILLTNAGQAFLPPVRNAFRQIAEASQRIALSADSGILTVSVTPFFAAAWLVPRLKSFQDAHPDLDLQIESANTLADFSRHGVDVAVRHGLGHYPGLHSERVLTVEMVPVAAPALVERLGMPDGARSLVHWPRVHDAERKGWYLWFEAQGIEDVGPPRGPAFDDGSLLLKSALAGQGASLLPAAMVATQIAEGQLVRLAEAGWIEEFAYYLVYPKATHARPKIEAFRSWILEEAAKPPAAAPAENPLVKGELEGEGNRIPN